MAVNNNGNGSKATARGRLPFFHLGKKPKSQKISQQETTVQQTVSLKTYAKNPNAHISEKKLDSELNFLRLKVVHHMQHSRIIIPADDHVKWSQIEKHNPNLAICRQEVEDFRNKVLKPSSLDALADRVVISIRQNHKLVPFQSNPIEATKKSVEQIVS